MQGSGFGFLMCIILGALPWEGLCSFKFLVRQQTLSAQLDCW